jgi:hypothetical protein
MSILQPSLNILMKRAQQEIERRQRVTTVVPQVFDIRWDDDTDTDFQHRLARAKRDPFAWVVNLFASGGPGEGLRRPRAI